MNNYPRDPIYGNIGVNITLKLMAKRMGNLDIPPKYSDVSTVQGATLMTQEAGDGPSSACSHLIHYCGASYLIFQLF